jgi:serine/threonine-protein kinase SRPK3
VHKVSFGASSTIWLACDEQLSKYVAIKLAISGLYRPVESAVMRVLQDGEGNGSELHAGGQLVPEMLDEFEVDGPDIEGTLGRHHCLVTTPARMNVLKAREAGTRR